MRYEIGSGDLSRDTAATDSVHCVPISSDRATVCTEVFLCHRIHGYYLWESVTRHTKLQTYVPTQQTLYRYVNALSIRQ